MTEWITTLSRARNNGQDACLVTVANVRGSAPREAGARMVVTAAETFGTIGGGQLEYQCVRLAVEKMRLAQQRDSAASQLRTFPLGSNCGQCCGGVVDVLFEWVTATNAGWLDEVSNLHATKVPFAIAITRNGRAIVTDAEFMTFELPHDQAEQVRQLRATLLSSSPATVGWLKEQADYVFVQDIATSSFHIAVFGAGHVGSAVVATLGGLDCSIRWIDSRRGILPAKAPHNVSIVHSDDAVREVAAMPAGSYFLIMTHSHALDFEICDQILRRDDAAYCGLIGSLSKRRRFEQLLRKQGLTAARLQHLTCPIGIDSIAGKRPVEIAISVAAELLALRGRAQVADTQSMADNVRIL